MSPQREATTTEPRSGPPDAWPGGFHHVGFTHCNDLLYGSIRLPRADTQQLQLQQQHSPLSNCRQRLDIAGVDRASNMVRITNRRIVTIHGDPSISGVGDPRTGYRQTSVRRTHCSARSFLVPQAPRLVWQVYCTFWVLLQPWWSFLSVGGGYEPYVSNHCAMLRSRMAAGMSKLFSRGIGQSRPDVRQEVDDFVQSTNRGALKD